MSILIRDANEVNLLAASGIALTASNGGDAGAGTALHADGTDVTAVLTLATSGSTLATVKVQVSADNFDDDIRTLGVFDTIDAATDDGEVRYMDLKVPGYPGTVADAGAYDGLPEGGAIYVRAHVTTGASAVLTGSTLYIRQGGYGLNALRSA